MAILVWNKYSQLINVSFIITKHLVKQAEKLLHHICCWVPNCEERRFYHSTVLPQHSCEKTFPDWCRFELTTSIVNLSMFSFNY